MNKFFLLIHIIFLISTEGFSQANEDHVGFEILTSEEWLDYKDMIKKLRTQNRINESDAAFLKLLSSSSFVAFRQSTDSVLNENGKISEEDIRLTFRVSSLDDAYLIIVTTYRGFCHSFKYDISKEKLIRILNKDKIILSGAETIKFEKFDNSIFYFYADNSYYEKGDWKKYFTLDLKKETFTHTKNCRIVRSKEECNFFDH